MKPTIFISHIHEERAIAHQVKAFIEKKFLKTVNVFASSHDDSLKLGDQWLNVIKNSVDSANLMIVLCSPISVHRAWINFEAGAGWNKGISVIPLLHSGLVASDLPVPLSTFQAGQIDSREDIRKLFDLIARLVESDRPDPDDASFFESIGTLQTEIENSILVKDTRLVAGLLSEQISALEYYIFASTRDIETFQDNDTLNLKDLVFEYRETYRAFGISTLIVHMMKKIYEGFHETLVQLAGNIKFLLNYSRITLSPSLREFFESYLMHLQHIEIWKKGLSLLISQPNVAETIKKGIKESVETPKPSNRGLSSNFTLAYFEDLLFYRKWIIQYHDVVDLIIRSDAQAEVKLQSDLTHPLPPSPK